jgi:hypothetical protein
MRKSGRTFMARPGDTSDGACGGTSGTCGGPQHGRWAGCRRQGHRRGFGEAGRRRKCCKGSRGQYRRAHDMADRAHAAIVPMIGRMCGASAVRSDIMRVARVADRLRGQECRHRIRRTRRTGQRHGHEGGRQPDRQHKQRHQHAGHARAGPARAKRGDHRGLGLSHRRSDRNPIMGVAVCIPAFPAPHDRLAATRQAEQHESPDIAYAARTGRVLSAAD